MNYEEQPQGEKCMKKWKVEIEETLARIVEVKADTKSEAIRIAKKKYGDEQIVLSSEDFVDNSFTILHS